MKKTFKLFGFIAFSMTLAVACGNANNTPAEEEVVAEETVEATEQVVEEVAAPATQTQATCDEKNEEVKATKAERKDAKSELLDDVKSVVKEQKEEAKVAVRKEVDDAKDQLMNDLKEGPKSGAAIKKNN